MYKKRNVVSFLLLAVFAAWQTDAVIHFLFTSHALDDHGHAVHADPESDHSDGDHEGEDQHEHEECRVLAFLTSGKTRVRDHPPLFAKTDMLKELTSIPYEEIIVLHGEDLFRLSPSHSPPSA